MSDLRSGFEETDTYLYHYECNTIYFLDDGEYFYALDDEPCFYLNGAYAMFQELNK